MVVETDLFPEAESYQELCPETGPFLGAELEQEIVSERSLFPLRFQALLSNSNAVRIHLKSIDFGVAYTRGGVGTII